MSVLGRQSGGRVLSRSVGSGQFLASAGGFFSDPFETPESHTGTMWYVGGRYTFNKQRTKLGAEFNHGSQYWLNFAVAEDDILAPKTSARGDVFEAYLTHRINPRFVAKIVRRPPKLV